MCYLPFLNEIKLIYHTISAIGHPAKILSIKKKKKKNPSWSTTKTNPSKQHRPKT